MIHELSTTAIVAGKRRASHADALLFNAARHPIHELEDVSGGSTGSRNLNQKNIPIAIVDFSSVGRRTYRRTKAMQYLLLIYADEKRWAAMDETTQGAEVGKCMAFGKEFAEHIKGSNSLQPTTTATTVWVRSGKRLTI